jgi:hypothetical protein
MHTDQVHHGEEALGNYRDMVFDTRDIELWDRIS